MGHAKAERAKTSWAGSLTTGPTLRRPDKE
jgi:hypothetical protein